MHLLQVHVLCDYFSLFFWIVFWHIGCISMHPNLCACYIPWHGGGNVKLLPILFCHRRMIIIVVLMLNNEHNILKFPFFQEPVGGNLSFNPCDAAGVSESLQKYELRASDFFFSPLLLVACDLS